MAQCPVDSARAANDPMRIGNHRVNFIDQCFACKTIHSIAPKIQKKLTVNQFV